MQPDVYSAVNLVITKLTQYDTYLLPIMVPSYDSMTVFMHRSIRQCSLVLLSLCVHVSFWICMHDSWIHVCAFECDCMRISLQLWIWWPGFAQIEMCHIVLISLHNLVWTKVKYQPWRASDLEHYIISVYITMCMYYMLHTLPKPPSSID